MAKAETKAENTVSKGVGEGSGTANAPQTLNAPAEGRLESQLIGQTTDAAGTSSQGGRVDLTLEAGQPNYKTSAKQLNEAVGDMQDWVLIGIDNEGFAQVYSSGDAKKATAIYREAASQMAGLESTAFRSISR